MQRCIALALLTSLTTFAQLKTATPESAGMSKQRLGLAAQILAEEAKSGRVSAAAIIVVKNGRIVLHQGFGKAKPDTVFLLASISKPVTATAVMMLVERGKISLNDPASLYLPELKGGQRQLIRVRDLLSHTSGLPDMLPENTDLRRAHAPLSDFVKQTFTTPLLYPPRTDFRYQSMGTLLAGEIVERVTGRRLRDFEKTEIFDPLGMKDSSLGLGGRHIEDTARCQTGTGPDEDSFGANSPYWRDMGHPWGGMHSTTTDLAIVLQTFLNGGQYNGQRLLSPSTVARMTSDQNGAIGKPWGLGWGLATSVVWAYFGDLVSPETFGHSGATGTVAWADPANQLITVILTTRAAAEDDGRLLRTVSNAVAAAVE